MPSRQIQKGLSNDPSAVPAVSYAARRIKCKGTNRKHNFDLFSRLRSGDEAARNEIITSNMALVWMIARRFKVAGQLHDDLFQTGVLALIACIDPFDHLKGVSFSTYATRAIRRDIHEELLRHRSPVRIPPGITLAADAIISGMATVEQFSWKERRGRTAFSAEALEQAMNALQSGHIPTGAWKQNEASVNSEKSDDRCVDPEDHRQEPEPWYEPGDMAKLMGSLGHLSDRNRAILFTYFGLGGHAKRSLVKTGEKFGITKERVRQINKESMGKLKAAMAS